MNIRLLVEEWENVLEGEEAVGKWAFHSQGRPIILRIKVVKTTNPSRHVNRQCKLPDQEPTTERSVHEHIPHGHRQEALEDALRGFLIWYAPEDVEETMLEPVDDW